MDYDAPFRPWKLLIFRRKRETPDGTQFAMTRSTSQTSFCSIDNEFSVLFWLILNLITHCVRSRFRPRADFPLCRRLFPQICGTMSATLGKKKVSGPSVATCSFRRHPESVELDSPSFFGVHSALHSSMHPLAGIRIRGLHSTLRRNKFDGRRTEFTCVRDCEQGAAKLYDLLVV